MFKVGQKVVCVDNSEMKSGYIKNSDLELNEIYTIHEVTREGAGCYIREVGGEFLCSRFRPIDESFAEETLEMIKEQIEEEYLVLK